MKKGQAASLYQSERRRRAESQTLMNHLQTYIGTRAQILTTRQQNPLFFDCLSAAAAAIWPSWGRLSFSILKGSVNPLQTRAAAEAAEPRAHPAAGFDGPSGRALRSCQQPRVPCLQDRQKRTQETRARTNYTSSSPEDGPRPLLQLRGISGSAGAFLMSPGSFPGSAQALKGPWSLPCLTPCLSFPPAEITWMLAAFLPATMEIRRMQQLGLISC